MLDEALRKHPGLGPLLKSWRRQVRLTQQEVAGAVSSRRGSEMTPNWYAKLENRENAYPGEEDLDHILEVLGRTRWEAERALGGESVDLTALADSSPEPQSPGPSWSADIAAGPMAGAPPAAAPPTATPRAAGSTVSGSTVSGPRAAAPRMLMGAAAQSEPPLPSADDDLRAALRRFGLSDAAAEEALAYARSLRARSQLAE